MYYCLKQVVIHSGTTDQSISGIADALTSTTFTPRLALIVQSGFTDVFNAGFEWAWGVDDTINRLGRASWEFYDSATGFTNPLNSGSSNYSILLLGRPGFISSEIRQAKFSSFGLGTATISYARNDFSGDSINILFLGGTDFSYQFGIFNPVSGNNTITTGFQTCTVMFWDQPGSSDSVGPDFEFSWGFMTDSYQASIATCDKNAVYPGNPKSSLRLDSCLAPLSTSTLNYANILTRTSLNVNGFTVNSSGSPGGTAYLALGNVARVGMTITQPITTGIVDYVTGIDVQAGIFISVGKTHSTTVQNDLDICF